MGGIGAGIVAVATGGGVGAEIVAGALVRLCERPGGADALRAGVGVYTGVRAAREDTSAAAVFVLRVRVAVIGRCLTLW